MTSRKQIKERRVAVKPITMEDLGGFADEVILPGVEAILDDRLSPLEKKVGEGFAEMRQGFKDIGTSIRVLAGEIAEIKVTMEDQKHEHRLRRVEDRLGLRERS